MGDDDRNAILARRKQFIALALAGGATVGAAAIGAGAYAVLAPCLSPPVTDGPPSAPDAGEIPPIAAGDPDAGPPAEVTALPPPPSPSPSPSPEDEPPAYDPEPEARTTTPRRPEAMPRACLSVARPHATESAETPPVRLPRVTE